jgi:hypothetical protein
VSLVLPPSGDGALEALTEAGRTLEGRRRTQARRASYVHQAYPLRPVLGWWSIRLTTPDAGSFLPLWRAELPAIVHTSVVVSMGVLTDATSTVQVRLRLTGPSIDLVSALLVVPANTYSPYQSSWVHGLPLWTRDITATVESLLTGTQVDVFTPYGGVVQREPVDASPTGVWFPI